MSQTEQERTRSSRVLGYPHNRVGQWREECAVSPVRLLSGRMADAHTKGDGGRNTKFIRIITALVRAVMPMRPSRPRA